MIKNDVIRTFQHHKFFTYNIIQETLISILCVWVSHHDLGYLQGMNEIAAIIFLQVFSEKYEDQSHPFHEFNHPGFLEHDSYHIFERLFETGMQNMYLKEKKQKKNVFIEFISEMRMKYSKEDILDNPVIKACHEVFEVYLNIIDPELFGYLNENAIEPHLFLL